MRSLCSQTCLCYHSDNLSLSLSWSAAHICALAGGDCWLYTHSSWGISATDSHIYCIAVRHFRNEKDGFPRVHANSSTVVRFSHRSVADLHCKRYLMGK